MTQREKLIELLLGADEKTDEHIRKNDHMDYVPTLEELYGVYADHLLANGVIVPPCKVGDTVYWYNMGGEIAEAKVKTIGFAVRHSKGFEYDVPFDVFGKTVFLTREGAEKAHAERSEGK
jgi:hypothetical protein